MSTEASMTIPQDMLTWFGHSSFLIRGSRIVYIDPYQIQAGPKADLILITHSHYDHFSSEDVAKIARPDTIIVTEKTGLKKLTGDVRIVVPGDTLDVAGVRVEVMPAYNVGKKFHPQKNGWLGFVLLMDGLRFYHAGDTDRIPEMTGIRVDVAMLPVSGTYVMTAAEAAAAAKDIMPGLTVPMHYGSLVGSDSDAREFARLLQGVVQVAILPLDGGASDSGGR